MASAPKGQAKLADPLEVATELGRLLASALLKLRAAAVM